MQLRGADDSLQTALLSAVALIGFYGEACVAELIGRADAAMLRSTVDQHRRAEPSVMDTDQQHIASRRVARQQPSHCQRVHVVMHHDGPSVRRVEQWLERDGGPGRLRGAEQQLPRMGVHQSGEADADGVN